MLCLRFFLRFHSVAGLAGGIALVQSDPDHLRSRSDPDLARLVEQEQVDDPLVPCDPLHDLLDLGEVLGQHGMLKAMLDYLARVGRGQHQIVHEHVPVARVL